MSIQQPFSTIDLFSSERITMFQHFILCFVFSMQSKCKAFSTYTVELLSVGFTTILSIEAEFLNGKMISMHFITRET